MEIFFPVVILFLKVIISTDKWDKLTTKMAVKALNNGLSYGIFDFFDICSLNGYQRVKPSDFGVT